MTHTSLRARYDTRANYSVLADLLWPTFCPRPLYVLTIVGCATAVAPVAVSGACRRIQSAPEAGKRRAAPIINRAGPTPRTALGKPHGQPGHRATRSALGY
jgi:hypothetical protein